MFNNNSKRTPKKNLRNQAESKKCNIEIAGEKKNMKIKISLTKSEGTHFHTNKNNKLWGLYISSSYLLLDFSFTCLLVPDMSSHFLLLSYSFDVEFDCTSLKGLVSRKTYLVLFVKLYTACN